MAKKKAKRKAPEKKFMWGWSDCGKLEQFAHMGGGNMSATEDASRKSVERAVKNGDIDGGATFYVMQVVAKSKSRTKVEW